MVEEWDQGLGVGWSRVLIDERMAVDGMKGVLELHGATFGDELSAVESDTSRTIAAG